MKEQPECIVFPSGQKEWRLNGKCHREDGPAIEFANGTKKWLLNGKYHREDGPAIEWADGDKSWLLNDKKVHPEQIVDLQLTRGTFCYYNEQANTLHFAENE
jgi:hypothetical protein